MASLGSTGMPLTVNCWKNLYLQFIMLYYYVNVYYIISYHTILCYVNKALSTDLLPEIRMKGVLSVLSVYCAFRQNYSKFRPIIYDKTAVVSFLKNVLV